MEKLFEKIGDHFNNPEMADRILVVKVRRDGWEKLEAAVRVKNISTKLSKTESSNERSPEKCDELVETLNIKGDDAESVKSVKEDSVSDDVDFSNVERQSASSLSVDSGIVTTDSKCINKRKKRGDSDVSPICTLTPNHITASTSQESSSTNENSAPDQNADPTASISDSAISKLLTDKCNVSEELPTNETAASGNTSRESGVQDRTDPDPVSVDSNLESTVVREHEIHVHSFWLALNSSYFRGLFFSSGMKETKYKKVSVKTGIWLI